MIAFFRRVDEFVMTAPTSLTLLLGLGFGMLTVLVLGVGFGVLWVWVGR